MALYKQKGSKVWWYEFQFDGTVYRESSKTRSKTLAADILRARRRQLEESFNGLRKRELPKTFNVAADDYLEAKRGKLAPGSIEMVTYDIGHLRPSFAKKLICDITPKDIQRFKDERLKSGASLRTINMELGTLRAILRRNGLWDRIRPDFSMFRIYKVHGKVLSNEEERLLIDGCASSISRVLFPAVTLALCTGMRLSEIRLLQWDQVDLKNRVLTVGISKTETGSCRRVPLNDRAVSTINNWSNLFPDRVPEHFVFPTEKYNLKTKGGGVTIYRHDTSKPMGSWKKAWDAVRRRTGIKCRFHDLRHTAVTRMLEAGTPLTTVAAIVGWSPSTMYLMAKRYGHIGQAAMRIAVAALEGQSICEAVETSQVEKKPVESVKPDSLSNADAQGQGKAEDEGGVAAKTSNTEDARKQTISKKQVAGETTIPKRRKKTA